MTLELQLSVGRIKERQRRSSGNERTNRWFSKCRSSVALGSSIRPTCVLVLFLFSLLLCCQSPSVVNAQQLDAISQEASQLEAELGKYNDNTPQAADVMVKLIDLYHSDARVFGLVRIGNRFVGTHSTDDRHHDVMLKTIDGLQAMSRNKDMIVACRQFLSRYPSSPRCAQIEQRLAEVLDRGKDKKAAAAAFHAIWKRQKNSDVGLSAAVKAIKRYTSLKNDQIKSVLNWPSR